MTATSPLPETPTSVETQGKYLQPGRVTGKYQITSVISTAGFVKEVYRARDILLDREGEGTYAVKVFRLPEDISNPRTRANLESLGGNIESVLQRELRAAKSLRHANLARLSDYGAIEYTTPSGQTHLYFIVEDYVPGAPLSRTPPFNGQPAAWASPEYFRDVAYTIGMVARGLSYLHRRNMAHLDIKPANIIVENPEHPQEGRVVVTDFTHASKIFGPKRHLQGSQLYDAPEECRDSPRHGTKADIWALGVTFYQALTGRYPFETSQPNWAGLSEPERAAQEEELVKNILTQQPELPNVHVSGVPLLLETLCLAMLTKTESYRPRAAHLARKLSRFASR